MNLSPRQHWIGVLARAQFSELLPHEAALKDAEYHVIRAPEIGMTLVRGRMGGEGAAFNVGEMSVTRCVVRLAKAVPVVAVHHAGLAGAGGGDHIGVGVAALGDLSHCESPCGPLTRLGLQPIDFVVQSQAM